MINKFAIKITIKINGILNKISDFIKIIKAPKQYIQGPLFIKNQNYYNLKSICYYQIDQGSLLYPRPL